MSDLDIIMTGLGVVLAVTGWAFVDNKRGHKDIYHKLHDDHNRLTDILIAMAEKLGGKADK